MIHDVRTYVFDPTADYFLDANIWLFVYGPMTPVGDPRVATYSDALKRLRASGASTYIDVLVMSEVVNSWARFEYNRARDKGTFTGAFKSFRSTTAYAQAAADIVAAMRSILQFAKRTGTPFANISLDRTFDAFEAGSVDFTDALICESCRGRRFIMVTDDGDMKDGGVDLVTANQRLI